MSFEGQIRPYLIGNHDTVISGINLHCLFDFLPRPEKSAGIVGGAEYGEMNMVFLQLPVHILIVHTPDAFFIPYEIA